MRVRARVRACVRACSSSFDRTGVVDGEVNKLQQGVKDSGICLAEFWLPSKAPFSVCMFL